MRKVFKSYISKRAFSLLEVLIVVAVIVILAGVVGAGVAGLINTSHRADDAVKASSESLNEQINNGESVLSGFSFGN
jgi:prepilin-type N-terminal cleavage/methylation domain-containing protein